MLINAIFFTAITASTISPSAEREMSILEERVERVVWSGIKMGAYPGAALIVNRGSFASLERGYGRLGWTTDQALVSPENTWYDLASLTKVLGTTTALMILVDRGTISLDDPASTWIPQWRETEKAWITIRQLLSHRSGLPAGRGIWLINASHEIRREALLNTRLVSLPGQSFLYSDLGPDVLGFIVERVTGQSLDIAVDSLVFSPLGLSEQLTYFLPDSIKIRAAPTELRPPRGWALRGEVHDENAYALGGAAGHAGLFGTARGVAKLASFWLDEGLFNGEQLVKRETVQAFTGANEDGRALGWERCGRVGSRAPTCGKKMSSQAYGHTGYTGTSVWIDPQSEIIVVLLTNRVHAPTSKYSQRILRDVRSDLADVASSNSPLALRSEARSGWVDRPKKKKTTKKRTSRRTTRKK